jgi:hypothetical protein
MINMSRIEDDRLDDCELELVFIAGARAEAKAVEDLLTGAGIDYCLDSEPFLRAGWFGPVTLVGVGFFVLKGQAHFCRELLQTKRLSRGIVDAQPE